MKVYCKLLSWSTSEKENLPLKVVHKIPNRLIKKYPLLTAALLLNKAYYDFDINTFLETHLDKLNWPDLSFYDGEDETDSLIKLKGKDKKFKGYIITDNFNASFGLTEKTTLKMYKKSEKDEIDNLKNEW